MKTDHPGVVYFRTVGSKLLQRSDEACQLKSSCSDIHVSNTVTTCLGELRQISAKQISTAKMTNGSRLMRSTTTSPVPFLCLIVILSALARYPACRSCHHSTASALSTLHHGCSVHGIIHLVGKFILKKFHRVLQTCRITSQWCKRWDRPVLLPIRTMPAPGS
jgi:hypothetical protein